MRIDNYSVQMNAQYYNLSFDSSKAKIVEETQDFEKGDSLNVSEIQESTRLTNEDMRLSKELIKAILQNISAESRKVVNDRLEISNTKVESQGLNFAVDAKVTAQGKKIDVSMDLSLSRGFVQQTKVSFDLLEGALKDPLILSLDGSMPNLSSKKFSFDIDSDGTSNQISLLSSKSAFLALDKNNNQTIDNGSELFGTKSGDGFGDLAKYDDDKNGWIDENDAIFDKLRVWVKHENKDELLALGEVGIGAIFLGNVQTPFSFKTGENNLLGEMRKSGMFLFESGKAGVISHIDLAVETKSNLSSLEVLQKNSSLKDINKLYENTQKDLQTKSEKPEDAISVLQGKIKSLQSKLSNANENARASIQMQIDSMQLQIISLMKLGL